MTFRAALLLAALALAIAGIALLYQSSHTPEWSDEDRATQIQSWPTPNEFTGKAFETYNKRWTSAMDAVRTIKWPLYDAGSTLVALGLSLAAGVYLLGIRRKEDLFALQTPSKRWVIYVLGTVAWFCYWGSALAALYQGFDRFEFPPWADTLLVPMITMAIFAALGWIVLSAIGVWVLWHAKLPVSLWIWRKDAPTRDIFFTVTAGFSILLALEILRETYCYGHWLAVPAMLLWIYATLAYRAAGITRAG